MLRKISANVVESFQVKVPVGQLDLPISDHWNQYQNFVTRESIYCL